MMKVVKLTAKKKATRAPAGAKSVAKKSAPSTAKAKTRKPALKLVSPAKSKAASRPTKKTSSPKKKPPMKQQATPPSGGSSVLWKFLQMKEERRRQHQHEQAEGGKSPGNSTSQFDASHQRHSKFSRFAGPRRRSA